MSSNRSKRNINRIDYHQLDSTGQRITLEENQSNPSNNLLSLQEELDISKQLDQLSLDDEMSTQNIEIEAIIVIQEVKDMIDENPILPEQIDDNVATLNRLQELRNSLHRFDIILKNKDKNQELLQQIKETLVIIKDYIKESKECKQKLNLTQIKQLNEELCRKERSRVFTIADLRYTMTELSNQFQIKLNTLTDSELLQLKSDYSSKSAQLNKAAEKYELLLQTPFTKAETLLEVKNLGEQYESLLKLKSDYTSELNELIQTRDIYKQKLFAESALNIHLEKFSGAPDSAIDYYTFKSNFMKLHERSTPRYLLPDLLKNNYLKDPALSMIKSLTDIDSIWKQLQYAYGDVKHLLSKKLSLLGNIDNLSRAKGANNVAFALSKIINVTKELIQLAETHSIEEYLYYGDGIQRIYSVLGDSRLSRWLSTMDEGISPKQTWDNLVQFLQKELKLQQQKIVIMGSSTNNPSKATKSPEASRTNKADHKRGYNSTPSPSSPVVCSLCLAHDGASDHVSTSGPGGTRLIQYYTCKRFAELTPAKRLYLLKEKGYCFQCLYPGADVSTGKHKEGRCQHDFVCQHESHEKYVPRKHVLVCEEHKDTQANKDLLQKYKDRCIRSSKLPTFAREISLSFVNGCFKSGPSTNRDDVPHGIFLFQSILINNRQYTIFFDNGCFDFIVKHSAVKSLGSLAVQESSDSIEISGVGNTTTHSTYGTYNVKIPMFNGQMASMSGTCMEDITAVFPHYTLDEPFKDICKSYQSNGQDSKMLPIPSSVVGGEVHLMIGMRYLRYHPKLIHQLNSGLAIYESPFKNVNGGRGVIGGPHPIFTSIHQCFFSDKSASAFFGSQLRLYDAGIKFDPDISISVLPSQPKKQFDTIESIGSEITYRCISCRSCKDCKNSNHQEAISIRDEMEQDIINSSISIDTNKRIITATLPFIEKPDAKLVPNKSIAMKIYYQQLRKLERNPKDKEDILNSEAKLQNMGFVDYVNNLSEDIRQSLQASSIQNFIPWRAVWKSTSLSTPCRIVFDASFPTASGYSLNDLLAKGSNNLNKLQEVMLRWSTYRVGIHTDVCKMYNTINLESAHWCYQRYIWHPELNSSKIPMEKVIKTLIYGIRSSGNQAERGLREIANLFQDKYPEVHRIIHEDVYVDDGLTGEESIETAHTRADQLEYVIQHGGFRLKGITFSGEDPSPDLTDDGDSIIIGGMKWYSKTDEISLNISQLNFSKKSRGKKSQDHLNVIPDKLTRRQCISKVAEIYDLTGKISPLVAAMKLDLQELNQRQLNWDDILPDELRQVWIRHFDTMKDIGSIRFRRSIVPDDAVNMNIETLDFGDASKRLVCACVYARFLLKNGNHSCQLVFSRTRTVPKELSLPRAELYAALINTYTSEIVRRSFKGLVKSSKKFTDSQIALHWISNDQKPLKEWVRNRVLDINRFTSKDQWSYIQSKDNIADLGTRSGAQIKDVNQSSDWINGLTWMHLPSSKFPVQSADDLKLTAQQLSDVETERSVQVHHATITSETFLKEMKKRYQFSKYLLDPMKHSFIVVIRIMAYVIRFVRRLSKQKQGTLATKTYSIIPTEDELSSAETYYFRKGSDEIRHFTPKSKYEKISTEKNGVLIYTGRILPSNGVSIVGEFTDIMKDLSADTFCVPLLEKYSLIAYSITMDVHWNHSMVKHSGIETTHRYILKKAHIIEGRMIIKHIRKNCERCRYLAKRTVDMAMGPVSSCNLTIAPAFYFTQLDLSGPYQSYSPSHKRTTVKIWLIVFCCCATSAVKIKVMDDYTTTSFIESFNRFSCDHGYPKRLLCDEGSQLVKGCKEMKIDYHDLKSRLMKGLHIDFDICPVQGHNMHGKVERKIKEINQSIEKSLQNHRLSIMQWETLGSSIANQINNLPIAVGDISGDFECMDLITPNRLLLGRNNERCPDGVVFCDNPSKILVENEKIYKSWFEIWLLVHVPKLMKQSKWFESDSINIGDVILFTKRESVLSNQYTYGIVKDLEYGNDMLPRKATIRYKNENENTMRETIRSVRGLVIIHSVNECDFMTELGEMAKNVDLLY